jgi:hypothetical protein
LNSIPLSVVEPHYIRKVTLRAVVSLATAFVASVANATPAPTAVSGSVSDGGSVTISGSGFGGGYSTPLLWENFDAPAGSASQLGPLTTPTIGSWVLAYRPTPVRTTAKAHSGTQSLYSAYNSGLQWSSITVALPPADRLYQSFWFWWKSAGTMGQLKLAQVHGSSGRGDFAPGIMTMASTTTWWFSYISTESGANDLATRASYPTAPSPGSWHHFEMSLQRSSSGGSADGSVAISIDGKSVYSKQHVVTRESSAYDWNETSFFHGVTNMGAATDVYVDDAYVNTTWARVVIGNAPTYSAVTQTELQPVSSWSDGSIRVTLNRGSLANFDNAYLYVFDSNGAVNSAGLKACNGCTQVQPDPPKNLTVQ